MDWSRNDAEVIDHSEITDSSKLEAWLHDENRGRIEKRKQRMLVVVRIAVVCVFSSVSMIRKASGTDIACEYADDLNTLKSDEITVKAG